MDTTFLDECFKARADYPRERFPLEGFRKKFKEEYARRGMVMMQPTIVSTLSEGVAHDCLHGFLFKTQHNLDIALWLVCRWGFSVTKRREHEVGREYTAYIVQLSDEYLHRQLGSDKAGVIRTGLRTLSNVDRKKKQKLFDYENANIQQKDFAPKVEPKQAWSGEDVRNIQDIDSVLFYDKNLSEDTCMRLRNWLKSLRPQSTWKPSDEQMQALSNAGNSFRPFEEGHKVLWSLYNDLKKLREE